MGNAYDKELADRVAAKLQAERDRANVILEGNRIGFREQSIWIPLAAMRSYRRWMADHRGKLDVEIDQEAES